jgi:hypothetical protein
MSAMSWVSGAVGFAVLGLGAGPADATPPAADCGPADGARVVNFSTSTCAEALDTISRFSADGGAAGQIGPWACHSIAAGDAKKLGYTVECLSGTGRLVLAQT